MSVEQLIRYAHDSEARHRPAWRAFNRNAARTTAVGIFHETFSVQSGHFETIYRAMPPTGLAAATDSVAPVARRGVTARDRLADSNPVADLPACPHVIDAADRPMAATGRS